MNIYFYHCWMTHEHLFFYHCWMTHEHLFLSLLDLITIMDVLPLASTEYTYAVRTILTAQCNRNPYVHNYCKLQTYYTSMDATLA